MKCRSWSLTVYNNEFILDSDPGNPSQSYGVSPAIWDHSVSCHPTQVNVPEPDLNPCQTNRYLVYLSWEGWKAEFTLALVIPEWFTCPPTVTHLSSNRLIPDRELNPRPIDCKSNTVPSHRPATLQTIVICCRSRVWTRMVWDHLWQNAVQSGPPYFIPLSVIHTMRLSLCLIYAIGALSLVEIVAKETEHLLL